MLRDGKGDGSIRANLMQCLKSKQASEQPPDIAYPQILQDIADAHKFSVTFVDVMEPTATGERLSNYILVCVADVLLLIF